MISYLRVSLKKTESPPVELKRGTEFLEERISNVSSEGKDELDRIDTLEEDMVAEEAAEAEEEAEAKDAADYEEEGEEEEEEREEEGEEESEYGEDEFPVPPSPGSVRAYPYPYAIRVPQFHLQEGEWRGGEGHPPPLPPPPPALYFQPKESQHHSSYPPPPPPMPQ